MLNFRGRGVPVLDVRCLVGFDKTVDGHTRIVSVQLNGTVAGLLVDTVSEVSRIPEESIELPPVITSDVDGDFTTSILQLPWIR